MRHDNAHSHNRIRHHLASKSFFISSQTTITITINKPTLYPTRTSLNESQGVVYIRKMRAIPKGGEFAKCWSILRWLGMNESELEVVGNTSHKVGHLASFCDTYTTRGEHFSWINVPL